MIDTIKLRLHGILDVKDDTLSLIHKEQGITNLLVPEHQALYKKLLYFKKKNLTTSLIYNKETLTVEEVSDDDFLIMENSKSFSQHYQNRNFMRLVDSKKTKEVNLRVNGSYRVPSSSSDVNFSINENGSYIDFEFSIPKYLYGHSLAQFIPQVHSNLSFDEGLNIHSWKTQRKHLYSRFLKVINSFFMDLCHFFELEQTPNLHYTEVKRIDLCYNQFFDTKSDALLFLENIKKLKKEKDYISKPKSKNFDTSYTTTTSFGSYFKVYHKGSEYSKTGGDLSKHMSINKDYIDKLVSSIKHDKIGNNVFNTYKENRDIIFRVFEDYAKENPLILNLDKKREISKLAIKIKSKLPFDVIFLKDEMDKVLRYEVTIRDPFLSFHYKTKVFRKSDSIHQQHVNIYKSVKSSLDSRNRNKQKVFKDDLRKYKHIHKFLSRNACLMLSRDPMLRRYERSSTLNYDKFDDLYNISQNIYSKTLLKDKDVGVFSKDFLDLCVSHFYKLIKSHQPKKSLPLTI